MTYPLILDCSHYQGTFNVPAIVSAGAVGVIMKATEINAVTGAVDAFYAPNKAACEAAGLFVGAYAYLDPVEGTSQAALLQKTAGLDGKTILGEDLENAGDTLQEAEAFINSIYDATGVWPVLYTGAYVIQRLNAYTSTVLAKCPLWLSAPGVVSPTVPKPWLKWTFHQFGYVNIDGKTFDCDHFNGTLDDLKEFWRVTAPIGQLTDPARIIAPITIPIYQGPGRKYPTVDTYKVGDTITIIHGSTTEDADNKGVFFVQTPVDMWVELTALQIADNTNPTPPPLPVPATVTRYATDLLNMRASASISSAAIVQIPKGGALQVTLPALTSQYHYISATAVINGKTYTGWVSNDYLTATAPNL